MGMECRRGSWRRLGLRYRALELWRSEEIRIERGFHNNVNLYLYFDMQESFVASKASCLGYHSILILAWTS